MQIGIIGSGNIGSTAAKHFAERTSHFCKIRLIINVEDVDYSCHSVSIQRAS